MIPKTLLLWGLRCPDARVSCDGLEYVISSLILDDVYSCLPCSTVAALEKKMASSLTYGVNAASNNLAAYWGLDRIAAKAYVLPC